MFSYLKIVGDDNGKGNSDIDCMCNIWTGTFYGVKTGTLYLGKAEKQFLMNVQICSY